MYDKKPITRFTREIVLKGVTMNVDFSYFKGWPATQDDMGADDELYIEAVYIEEFDCYHLMGSKTLVEIEAALLKILEEGEGV